MVAFSIDRVADGGGSDERSKKAEQPPVPVCLSENPDEGRIHDVEKRRVIAGIEGINVGVLKGKTPLTEHDGIDQFKAFALIIVEGELHQIDGVDDVNQKVAEEDKQRRRDEDTMNGQQGKTRRGNGVG